MSFEDKSTDQLIRIARAGLGFVLDQNSKPMEDIQQIIDEASRSGAIVTLSTRSDELTDDFGLG